MKGWEELKRAFFAAVDGDDAERARQIAALATIDPALPQRLEDLLAADARGETLQYLFASEPVPATPLPPRIGSYDIVGVLGVGGMGEVYRARDARLQREVAIKVLPPAVTHDRERLARFEREAQVLASLNHPNIAQVYGLAESDGAPALVMELVAGPTLAAVIDRYPDAPLTLPRALDIGRQIADGLDAAHEKGIIHRDLKPGNVVLTPEGQVKILDFGVAKTLDARAGAEGATAGTTAAGMVIGTPAYMSPEQARGLPVDRRTDVWALACVLYELLTGRQAFAGDTASDSLAAVLERQPDLTILPADTPVGVRTLLRHGLEKDPKRRLRDVADARLALEDALVQPQFQMGRADPSDARTPAAAAGGRRRVGWVLGGLAVAALAVLAVRPLVTGVSSTEPPRRVITSVVLPRGLRLGAAIDLRAQSSEALFALSPDGRQLALIVSEDSALPRLWIRDLSSAAFQMMPQTEGASFPFWSPDSSAIGFVAMGKLKAIRLSDRTLITLSDNGYRTGAWSGNNRILFAPKPASPLFVVPASGGTAAPVTTLDPASGEVQNDSPSFLPDGRHFLYFSIGSTSGVLDPRGIYLGSLDAAEPARLLLPGATQARYASGHVLFVRNGTLMAQPFDTGRLTLGGAPFPLVEDVALSTAGATGATAAFSVSDTGVLAYQAAVRLESRPVMLDRNGRQLAALAGPADYGDVALSPDGTRLAVSVTDPARSTRDLWLYDVEGGRGQRLTFDAADEFAPVWAPDGVRLLFSVLAKGLVDLYIKDVSTAGNPVPLEVDSLGLGRYASDWSRDGRHIVYIGGGRAIARSDLWVAPMAAPRQARALLDSTFVETHGRFAPSGHWFAYASNETGQLEIYVDRFESRGAKRLVSTRGGRWPRWSRDGSELFYVSGDDQLMSVAITAAGNRLDIGEPRPLFRIRPRPAVRLDAYPYDVMPDGRRFVVNTLLDDTSASAVTIVLNWTAGTAVR